MNTYEFSSCQNDLIKKIKPDHKILGRQFSESLAFLYILQGEMLFPLFWTVFSGMFV